MTDPQTPATEAGRCPICGQRFSPKGLAIHRGIKHRTRKTVADLILDAYMDGFDKGQEHERKKAARRD